MTKLCTRCHRQPRKPGQCYCVDCSRTYQREWARKNRGQKPRPVKPVLNEGEKFCFKCERILPVERFSRCSSKRDGRASCCKECDYLRQLVWRSKNEQYRRERDRRNQKAWREKHPNYNREYLAKRKRLRIARKIEQAKGVKR